MFVLIRNVLKKSVWKKWSFQILIKYIFKTNNVTRLRQIFYVTQIFFLTLNKSLYNKNMYNVYNGRQNLCIRGAFKVTC